MTNAWFHAHHLHQQVKVNHISQFWAPQFGVGAYITPCGCFPSPLAFRFHTNQAFSPAKTFRNALKQVWITCKECIKMLATCRAHGFLSDFAMQNSAPSSMLSKLRTPSPCHHGHPLVDLLQKESPGNALQSSCKQSPYLARRQTASPTCNFGAVLYHLCCAGPTRF
jgi:hypothetical protein